MRRIHNCLKTGDVFGRLTVVREIVFRTGNVRRSERIRYLCRCSCNKMVEAEAYRLVSGHVKSCGCFKSEEASKRGKSKKRHGEASKGTRTTEYMVWVRMRRRCDNPDSDDYPNYGGRGIRVCKRWQLFENFLADMGRKPAGGYVIDRRNNDGNYEPSNCAWVTVKESNRNKRTIRRLLIDGVEKTLPQWSDESGVHQETIRGRLRRGWSHKEAVFGEIRQQMKRVGNRWGKRK